MFDVYKPEKLAQDAAEKAFIVETAIELASLIAILKAKGFVAEVELQPFREKFRDDPKFKDFYKSVQDALSAARMYKDNPQAYLAELFKAKMNGKA